MFECDIVSGYFRSLLPSFIHLDHFLSNTAQVGVMPQRSEPRSTGDIRRRTFKKWRKIQRRAMVSKTNNMESSVAIDQRDMVQRRDESAGKM